VNRLIFLFLSIILLAGQYRPFAQQAVIDSPRPGEALQGQVTISGTTDLEGFQSYEVSFAYQEDTTGTWFPLYSGKEAVKAGSLATWDTTTISDGTYRLRLMIFLADGRAVQTIVSGLRVRNYTAVETATAAPEVTAEAQQSPASADYTPHDAAPDPLGINPAQISRTDLGTSLAKGGLIALGLFILFGLYLAVRALFRRF
jgi:hypothetical protein